MLATINGMRLAYSERGRNHDTALLLIHGFPLDHRLWDGQLAGLSSLLRVIAPDLRGHGRSEMPPGPYSMDLHADDMAGLLDHLKIQKAVVAGLSMGGYIAFAFWRRHASRVQALILADTRAEPDTPQARANRDASIAGVKETGAEAFAQGMLPRLLAPVNLANPGLSERALRIMASQPVAGTIAALGALRDRPDSRPTLPTINVPTLVLVGQQDSLTPPADGRVMAAAIPNADLAIVPRAGHLSPLENAREVNKLMRAFLRELPAVPGASK
jgi:3-oxoadipate enol-lactonase